MLGFLDGNFIINKAWGAPGGSKKGNGYVKNWTYRQKWDASRDHFLNFLGQNCGGDIFGRWRQKSPTRKFEFVTEIAVPFFRPPVAPHELTKEVSKTPVWRHRKSGPWISGLNGPKKLICSKFWATEVEKKSTKLVEIQLCQNFKVGWQKNHF